MNLSKNRTVFTLLVASLILIVGMAVIFWGRGFKPDLKNGRIGHTGLIVATSIPTGAQVYLNDRLTSATDTNIAYLDPGNYKVRIQKDGYTTWEKEIPIKADLATEIKTLLFPTAPQITPLTTTGASGPTLSPDHSKLVYGVSGVRGGAYVLPLDNRIFPFRQDARLLAKNTGLIDFSKARFTWDPDSKQIIAQFTDTNGTATANLILDSDKTDQNATDVTASLNSLIASWQDTLATRAQTQGVSLPQSVKDATATAAQPSPSPSPSPNSILNSQFSILNLNYFPTGLILSPDEQKVLYKINPPTGGGKYKVYDLKEKKEFTIPDFADFINIAWFPDSAHLVVAQKNLISVIDQDGTNKMGIYSGKFEDGFVFAHPSGNRIIILTTLTQQEGTPPNLYGINLK